MIFYFYGANDFALHSQVEAIRAQYTKKTGGDLEMEQLDMSEHQISDLLDSLSVVPMFVTSRLIVVRGLSANKVAAEKIDEIVEVTPDSTILVVVDSKPDKRSKVFKALSKLPKAKEFKSLSDGELQRWIRNRVSKAGGQIDARTASQLAMRVGNDQWQLNQEVQKLVLYNPEVTSESVELLVTPNFEQTIFELIDAVARHQTGRVLELYKRLSLDGVADQQILAMLNWQYRNLVLAKDNEGRDQTWAREFGIAPFAASKAAGMVRNLEMNDLKKAYHQIVQADLSIKSGEVPSALALEQLLVSLSQ